MRIIIFLAGLFVLTSCDNRPVEDVDKAYQDGKDIQELINRVEALEAEKVRLDTTMTNFEAQTNYFLKDHATAIKSLLPKPPPISITKAE